MAVLDTIKAGVNVAGNIVDALTDVTIKDFYSIRDFYNFIRKEQNCPMQHKNFFTVVPEIPVSGMASFFSGVSDIGSFFTASWNSIKYAANAGATAANAFQLNEYNLARFALAINDITMPAFENTSTIQTLNSPFGKYTYLKDHTGYLNAVGSNQLTMKFIQMAKPVIEDFIIPWQIRIQQNTINKDDQYFKINLMIKFYRTDELAGMTFLMNPAFIYRITGVFPKSVELVKPVHGPTNSGITNRQVTFGFDNVMVYSNAEYEKLIAGGKLGFKYDNLSPLQILNKLNSQVSNVSNIYNQITNIF